ncbi:UDP-2,3-diacylglucosamine diphosphatase [Cellvibrio polysaccharolyticus]|uniref:UDP-2,3-diacylglucosamine hydrolase n=1 Tax=Cellvibrio polysaccharolyticus TaxID=2082724 RepID=A0A928V2R1_9GAMM|nr:UDP-2,3-diacylglucosamine diphosphatase [Cellvibrio polysaccharolyticus]MBE8717706.1 UDP-2,3-diacylglucosamine diphosphatase [Cellvibrio polysaccharolyticus]
MTALFISDLHLNELRPDITRAFYVFLQQKAAGADALYILGDFFDAWIGDDDDSELSQGVATALKQLSDQGTRLFFMHGNRDFLLGQDYASRCGATLIDEGTLIDLYGCPTLLLHGDSLCIDDIPYQQFRNQVRMPAWQQQVLAQPLAVRRVMAANMRSQSEGMNSLKASDIMDVNLAEVSRVMQSAGVQRLIHGHTHRPARHQLEINNQPAERIVLGDWHSHGWCLTANEETLELESWPL